MRRKSVKSLLVRKVSLLVACLVMTAFIWLGSSIKQTKPVGAQASSGGPCRVGIAIDRSGSVAQRDPRYPRYIKTQLKSLFRTTDGVTNRIDNPNIELTFWSFGTAASSYVGDPNVGQPSTDRILYPPSPPTINQINGDGVNNTDYPYYVYGGGDDGSQEQWINTTEDASSARADRWIRQVDRVPFYIGPQVFNEPGFVAGNVATGKPGYPVWAARYPPVSPFIFFDRTIPNLNNGNPVGSFSNQPGTLPYFGSYGNDFFPDVSYFYANYAGSTNWEAGLGSNFSGRLGSWGGVQQANEADIVVLFTDAIEHEHSSTWFTDPNNKEPNWPKGNRPNGTPIGYPPGYFASNHYTLGQAYAHRAADVLRQQGKTVVVLSFDPNAYQSTNYEQIANSDNNIYVVDGNLGNLGDRLQEIAQEKCFAFSDRPFLQVFNGDVIAGSRFGDELSACSSSVTEQGIYAFNHNLSTNSAFPAYWVGSSSHFAASATGQIQGFFSANRRNSATGPPQPTDGLTFGNFNAGTGGIIPGDSGISRCVPDYYEIYSNQAGATEITTGSFNRPSIASGEDEVFYKDGDLYINGPIDFASNGVWGNLNGLSSFTLVVRGDIYIRASVSELNGTFIALPRDDGSGNLTEGRIFTCATGNGVLPSRATMLSTCSQKLTINGSFIARQVKFLRTRGNVETAALTEPGRNDIAEEFVFPYDIYLSEPTSTGSTSSGPYDNIISLPPIL